MAGSGTMMLVAFLMASSLVLLIALLVGGKKDRLEVRLNELAGPGGQALRPGAARLAQSALPKRMAAAIAPRDEKGQKQLKSRLVQAGLYKRQAMVVFLAVKLVFMVSPILVGVALGSMGVIPFRQAVLWGVFTGVFGTITPSFWLDRQKAARQTNLRRAMPDALDVIVICLEGGLSLPAAFARVATELRMVHPLLAMEMNIVQREIQLGRSTGEALRQLAERFDIEEIRSMASVITQAERFGASVSKALRVHADSLRLKRQQRAEEMAQKAGIKMLFPTLLFIFPAIFVVILGPAAIQIQRVLLNVSR